MGGIKRSNEPHQDIVELDEDTLDTISGGVSLPSGPAKARGLKGNGSSLDVTYTVDLTNASISDIRAEQLNNRYSDN